MLGIFALNGLEDSAVREKVYRIPEVSFRVKEAQKIFDAIGLSRFDLFHIFHSKRAFAVLDGEFKKFLVALVSVGLFDRHVRFNCRPTCLILPEEIGIPSEHLRVGEGGFKSLSAYIEKKASYLQHGNLRVVEAQPATDKLALRIVPLGYPGEKEFVVCGDINKIIDSVAKNLNILEGVYFGLPCADMASIQEGLESLGSKLKINDSVGLDPRSKWMYCEETTAVNH